MNLATIIKKPVITEKSLRHAGQGIFTFVVDTRASKDQIRSAIESIFSVTATKVRVLKHKGKTYRVGRTRIVNQKPDAKIAKITLKSGQTIDLFDIEETK